MLPDLGVRVTGVEFWEPVGVVTEPFLENPGVNPPGNPPTPTGLERPPGGGDRIRPPTLTSCLMVELRPKSTLPLFCFAFAISAIHAGCCCTAGVGLGLGVSGLFNALSNQLDFVGLHLFGSMVLDGLEGTGVSGRGAVASKGSLSPALLRDVWDREAGRLGFVNLSSSFVVDVVMLLLIELGVLGLCRSWVIVALL